MNPSPSSTLPPSSVYLKRGPASEARQARGVLLWSSARRSVCLVVKAPGLVHRCTRRGYLSTRPGTWSAAAWMPSRGGRGGTSIHVQGRGGRGGLGDAQRGRGGTAPPFCNTGVKYHLNVKPGGKVSPLCHHFRKTPHGFSPTPPPSPGRTCTRIRCRPGHQRQRPCLRPPGRPRKGQSPAIRVGGQRSCRTSWKAF